MPAALLIADLSAAIVAHLAATHPDWSVAVTSPNGRRIAVSNEGDALAQFGATIWIEDDARRFAPPTPRASAVQVSPTGEVRKVTYKSLDDVPTLCAKIEARLAEGFASAARQREAYAAKRELEQRAQRCKARLEAEHPQAFEAGCRHEWGADTSLKVPGNLAAIALDAIEAHLAAQKATAAASEETTAAGAVQAPEGAEG